MADPTTAVRQDRHIRQPEARWARRAGALLMAGALALGLTAAATPAQAASPAFCSDGSQPYVPVSEVRGWQPGHAVNGKTVTQGITPEGFTGSYIGFVADALGKGKDLLLFRLKNPTIDGTGGIKAAGIWEGMSGSPVYDTAGRLIGAVAYSLNSDNLPVAGVTPAAYMKTIGTTALEQPARVRLTSANMAATPAAERLAGTALTGRALSLLKAVNLAGGAGAKQNAFVNRTLARTPKSAAAASRLRSGSFMTAPRQLTNAKPLVAGGNIFVGYTSGDEPIGALGTVTAICGKTVWAFGHLMDLAGKVSLFMSNASAVMIVPDSTGIKSSFKQVSQIYAPVGMITQDRNAGIRGTIGATRGFPLTVTVKNPRGTVVGKHAAAVADPEVAASAAATLTGQAAFEQLDQVGAGTGKVSWTIGYRRANGKTGTIRNSQVISDRSAFLDAIGTPPSDDVWAITSQNHENASITGIKVTVTLLSADAVAYRLVKIQRSAKGKWSDLAGTTIKTGSGYSLRPVFQVVRNGRPNGSTPGKPFALTLPTTARTKGSLKVVAGSLADGSAGCKIDEGDIVCPDWSDPPSRSFAELLAMLDSQTSNADLTRRLTYQLTKGSKSVVGHGTGLGVTIGSTTARFTIAN